MQLMDTILARRQRERASAPRSIAPQRRTHEERSAETQSALVEAAIATLCDVGYAGITTAEVSRRASCTTGAMHHHFGSKGELMLAVLTRLSLEFEQAYRDVPALAARKLQQRCDGVVDALAQYYRSVRYVAVWELHVGTRCDAALNRICVENRARTIAAFEAVWVALFADVKASRADLLALMHFMLTYLRCLGIERSLGIDPGAGTVHLEVLKQALFERLESFGMKRTNRAAAKRPGTPRRPSGA
jgi:AcrR family transcriptional regulator